MEKGLRDVSWWQFRSKLERRLIILAAVLALIAFILLITVIIIASSKTHSCTKPACIQASSRLLASINPTVKPCNDFYKYTCGKFVDKSNFEPAFYEREELVKKAKKQFDAIFREKISRDDSIPLKNLKLIYRKCVDVEEIDSRGFDDVKEILEKIGGWPVLSEYSKFNEVDFNWLDFTVKLRKAGLDYNGFITFSDVKINGSNYFKLLPKSVEDDEIINGLKKQRTKLLIDVAEAYGAEKARASYDMKLVSEFIIDLNKVAETHKPEFVPAIKLKLEKIEEIQRASPEIQWYKFLKQILSPAQISTDDLIAFNLTLYMKDLNSLLRRTPKRVQANYLIWNAFKQIHLLEPRKISNLTEDFHKLELKALNVTFQQIPRSQMCMKLVNNFFGGVAETSYADKYAPQETRDDIHNLITQIKGELKEIIENTKLLDEDTKEASLKKLDTINEFIGGSDYNLEKLNLSYAYIDLEHEENLMQMFTLISKSLVDFYYINFDNKEVNTALELLGVAKTVNAYYAPNNYIVIPAAILQATLYDKNYPDYFTYATLGHVLGHEISHALTHSSVFKIGDEFYDEIEDWWSETSMEEYLNRAECLVDLYENYTTRLYNKTLNGTNTLNENLADLLGVRVAYRAFQKYSSGSPILPGFEDFSSEQLFWLNIARFYCDPREEDLVSIVSKKNVKEDPHALSSFRIYSSIGNNEDFSRDFNCGVDDPMNFKDKCEIF